MFGFSASSQNGSACGKQLSSNLQRKAWRDQETESTSCLNLRWESRYEFLLDDKYSRFLSLPSPLLLLGGYLYCWGLTQAVCGEEPPLVTECCVRIFCLLAPVAVAGPCLHLA